ncbi:putative MPP superfamily phosphohydrolase [Methanofollis sp. W23]|uniref:metallophosphoesterase n=1 Tax=Methanofollis sp. W23 TaxID=2817849 RepID=UPI001AE95D9F|nr:metallophosphoesterase [Methanofollis sp. W23]MBP2146450.1 putative MPP superfamily phosphohydrolase [Methanofollis sp. W23]
MVKPGLLVCIFMLIVLVVIPAALYLSASAEAETLTITHLQVEGVPGTVVFIADLHLREETAPLIERAVEEVNALSPALVLMGGDFVSSGEDDLPYLGLFAGIEAPTYAVLGNHEYRRSTRDVDRETLEEANLTVEGYDLSPLDDGSADAALADAVTARLEAAGVEVLRNDYAVEMIDGRRLLIVGLDDALAGRTAYPDDLPGADYTLVLLHEPEYRAAWDADLLLCGHTHGGQVDLPLIGKPAAWFGHWPFAGRLEEGDRTLYVSRGLGTTPFLGMELRFNCPPEIVVIEG